MITISGSSEAFRLCALKSILLIMLQLTDCSPQIRQELGLSGFVALLNGILKYFVDQPLLNEVI